MSLVSALNIGRSALTTSQAALQTTGNNIANAGNADYTRQVAGISSNKDQQLAPGIFLGTGVNLDSVQRQIDESLEGRIRGSISDDESASTTAEWLGRVEATFNELSDQDLSTQLSTFFNSWSNLANKPQDLGLRQVVVQNGTALSQTFNDLDTHLGSLQSDVDQRLEALAGNADSIASQIADLNGEIVQAEGGGGGTANSLRDQRDALLKNLSELIDIKTVPQDNGVTDVYVASEPLVIGTDNRGVGFEKKTVNGVLETSVINKGTGGALKLQGGQIGALSEVRKSIDDVIDNVDSLANNLIFELNKIHSSGQGLQGLTLSNSTNFVNDPAAALNSDTAGLKFDPTSGSFVVHVTNKTTGLSTSTLVQVDLDGTNGNDTTLNSLAASLDGIDGISATVGGGRISIKSDASDTEFSFSQDSSGTLAALGINSFFSGGDASSMTVNDSIVKDASLLSAAKNGEKGDNQTALQIAALESAAMKGLNGASVKDSYEQMINGIATGAAAAKTNADATATVRETLTAQRESLSGVSLDEEAINLIQQQRAFQGAAKLITTINEMMQTLLNMT